MTTIDATPDVTPNRKARPASTPLGKRIADALRRFMEPQEQTEEDRKFFQFW